MVNSPELPVGMRYWRSCRKWAGQIHYFRRRLEAVVLMNCFVALCSEVSLWMWKLGLNAPPPFFFFSLQCFKSKYLKRETQFPVSAPGNVLSGEWPEMGSTCATESVPIPAHTGSMKCYRLNAHLHLQLWPMRSRKALFSLSASSGSWCRTSLPLVSFPRHPTTPCSWGTSSGFCCP